MRDISHVSTSARDVLLGVAMQLRCLIVNFAAFPQLAANIAALRENNTQLESEIAALEKLVSARKQELKKLNSAISAIEDSSKEKHYELSNKLRQSGWSKTGFKAIGAKCLVVGRSNSLRTGTIVARRASRGFRMYKIQYKNGATENLASAALQPAIVAHQLLLPFLAVPKLSYEVWLAAALLRLRPTPPHLLRWHQTRADPFTMQGWSDYGNAFLGISLERNDSIAGTVSMWRKQQGVTSFLVVYADARVEILTEEKLAESAPDARRLEIALARAHGTKQLCSYVPTDPELPRYRCIGWDPQVQIRSSETAHGVEARICGITNLSRAAAQDFCDPLPHFVMCTSSGKLLSVTLHELVACVRLQLI